MDMLWNIVRKTEIPEIDVYVCESRYDDLAKSLRKLKTGGIKVCFSFDMNKIYVFMVFKF